MQIDLIPFIPILIKSNVDEFLNDCTAQYWEEMNWRELKRVLSDTCACIQAWQCAAGLGWVLSVFQSPAAAAHQPQLSQLHWSLHTPAREHFHIPSKNSSSDKCYIQCHDSLFRSTPSKHNFRATTSNPKMDYMELVDFTIYWIHTSMQQQRGYSVHSKWIEMQIEVIHSNKYNMVICAHKLLNDHHCLLVSVSC